MTEPTTDLILSPAIQAVFKELGYTSLTKIQAQAIPALLAGRDVVGKAQTGSGKTAAFTVPLLEKLDLRGRRLQAMVLCPTRELCTQVAREIRKLGRRHLGLQVLVLSGGLPLGPQAGSLQNGVHVVVGTPGRVLDHLNRNNLDLRALGLVVLDEADRMLDMGFEEDMAQIMRATPKDRQTVFFSATFPPSIVSMTRLFQTNALIIDIESTPEAKPEIRQQLVVVDPSDKVDMLKQILQKQRPESAIVFCNHKITVAELAQTLADAGASAACIHGDMEQPDRDRIMARFRNRSIRLLIATDVAARGIDIEALDLVVNFDLPQRPDVYVHRIGRTGRAGKKGFAVSMATPRERLRVQTIEEFTGQTFERPAMQAMAYDDDALSSSLGTSAAMATLFISGGRKEKLRPGDILGALTGDAAGLEASSIGKIEIHDRFAYVAVTNQVSQAALECLRNGRIKGRKFQVELVR